MLRETIENVEVLVICTFIVYCVQVKARQKLFLNYLLKKLYLRLFQFFSEFMMYSLRLLDPFEANFSKDLKLLQANTIGCTFDYSKVQANESNIY